MPFSWAWFVFWGSVSFAAGVILAVFVVIPLFVSFGIIALSIAFFGVFWRRKKAVAPAILLLMASLGFLRAHQEREGIPVGMQQEARVEFEAAVLREAYAENGYDRVVVDPTGPAGKIPGKVLVFTDMFSNLRRGDRVFVKGELEIPPSFDDFDYRMFLFKDGVLWTMFRPEIEVAEPGRSFFEELRRAFRSTIEKSIPAPESFVASAMFLGDRFLPEDMKTDLNATGTRHIIAISGMHVALFASMIGFLFLAMGLGRRHAYAGTILFVFLYILLTGFQASAVRSAIMGGAFFAGGMTGRRNDSLRMLAVSAAAMLLFKPFLARYDAGFQLSFLAVLGIAVFLPFLKRVFEKVFRNNGIREILGMTLASQVFTFPVLALSFGSFSVISVLPNLLIVPLLPVLFVFGSALIAAGTAVSFLSGFLALPAYALLSFMLWAIGVFARVPFASVAVPQALVLLVVPLSIAAGIACWRRNEREQFPHKAV
ncbi:MAG: ComEC/Rec2 family competence protein [Candidatus Wildermuthbacteria bacterium]|nr:ComEC/Rec2 family competence protein [Candidatus Wildermuthbacteria bacterium]